MDALDFGDLSQPLGSDACRGHLIGRGVPRKRGHEVIFGHDRIAQRDGALRADRRHRMGRVSDQQQAKFRPPEKGPADHVEQKGVLHGGPLVLDVAALVRREMTA